MKSLTIKKINCKLSVSRYKVAIDGKSLEEFLLEKLPKDLEDYSDYLANVKIIIALPESTTEIETEGYSLDEKIPEDYEKEIPEEVTKDGEVGADE